STTSQQPAVSSPSASSTPDKSSTRCTTAERGPRTSSAPTLLARRNTCTYAPTPDESMKLKADQSSVIVPASASNASSTVLVNAPTEARSSSPSSATV